MNGLIQMLPVIGAGVLVNGLVAFIVARLYDGGALSPESLSVRKSAQTRFEALSWPLALTGLAGFAFLVSGGFLTEILRAALAQTVILGTSVFIAAEVYAGRLFGLSRERKTALRPIGRRFGAFGLSAALSLAGYTLAAFAPLVGVVGYTAYAAYKSD